MILSQSKDILFQSLKAFLNCRRLGVCVFVLNMCVVDHVRFALCYHRMAHSQVADGRDGFFV